jgi:hypothetical protein
MTDAFQRTLETTRFPAGEILAKTRGIHAAVLRDSRYIDAANFRAIHPHDLALLFEHYDREFFGGQFRETLGDAPLAFRLSPRMTSAGGKTICYPPRSTKGRRRYEIAVSTTLLFQTFHDLEREIVVTGIRCHDRLEALQRAFEHELVHLAEMLVWDQSSCSAERFQSIARNFFGHTHHRHKLITPKERAYVKYGLRPGSRVRFHFEGREYEGIVNRVTRRATVLVEDPNGQPFSNGKRYAKFYIPVEILKPAE